MKRILGVTSALATFATLAAPAYGQGQVNGAGATLFVDFFRSASATTDFIDVDGDGLSGPLDPNVPPFVLADQLVNSNEALYTLPTLGTDQLTSTWWVLQYRSVGSVEGYQEWVNYQLCGDLPEVITSERGIINRDDFAVTGVVTWVGPPSSCIDDTDGDGIPNASGTPVCPQSIDFGNTDVESSWTVVGPGAGANAVWDNSPTATGYGRNPMLSRGTVPQSGENNLLAQVELDCDGNGSIDAALNFNRTTPDTNTIYDNVIAFSPVAPIVNRGTGVTTLRYTDLQHLYVTGRSASGENLAVAVRDVGSGTRNAWANPLGIDPSFCVGDHVGKRINSSTPTNLGPGHQVSNCGGSSIIENAVEMRRTAIGFTGLFGASRAQQDAAGGRYEIANVIKDIDTDGDLLPDGTLPVRPDRPTVIMNDDPDTGYQIGGLQTFATVGNPNANRDPLDPLYNASDPPMDASAQDTADFINNITSSIDAFVDPNSTPVDGLMPAQFLARDFALVAAVEALPTPTNPKLFVSNSVNANLQTYILGFGSATPVYGAVNAAGRTPRRNANPDFNGNAMVDPNDVYSDGSANGNYRYNDGGTIRSIAAGAALSSRNRLTADFNEDGSRDFLDAEQFVLALIDPVNFSSTDLNGSTAFERGGMTIDVIIPEVIGDLNGDGNFDDVDAREWADGFAIDPNTGDLERVCGFFEFDFWWFFYTGTYCWPTILVTGEPYEAGDAMADIAGSALGPIPGWSPSGYDGVVDDQDIDYICANFGDWSILDEAINMDLSADMNADLVVNQADVIVVVEDVLDTRQGDLELDGDVDITDLSIQLSNFGTPSGAGWADGDMDCDGDVDIVDLALTLSSFGYVRT